MNVALHSRDSLLRSWLMGHAALCLFVLLLGVGCSQQVQTIPAIQHAAIGLSDSKRAAVDATMNQLVTDGKIAGSVVLIAQHGEVVHFEAYGQRDTEPAAPMQTDTIFRIWSMTKPVATAAALILVDEGKLKLDDPVAAYIPELKDIQVQVGDERVTPHRPMTVADLMRHTAGFSYGSFGHPVDPLYIAVDPLGAEDLEDMARRLPRLVLANHPGERWQYSLSIEVLGLVIERVSGQGLDVFLQERVFDPLGMPDTGFHCPTEKHGRLAAVYSPAGADADTDTGTTARRHRDKERFTKPTRFFSGGAGLVSTARDYAHFLMMVRGGGAWQGRRILEPQTAALMITDQLPPEAFPIGIGKPRPGVGFGFGFSVRRDPDQANPHDPVGRYGWNGAASTHAWVSPADDVMVITLEQRLPYSNETADLLKPILHGQER